MAEYRANPPMCCNDTSMAKTNASSTGSWSSSGSADYYSLFLTFNIPCLSSCRTIAKLILLHKFIYMYKQMFTPENFFSFHYQHSHNTRSCHPLNLGCPLSQTSASQHFFPQLYYTLELPSFYCKVLQLLR